MCDKSNMLALIRKSQGQFEMALGGATPAEQRRRGERFTRLCCTAVQQTPGLLRCTPVSILGAMMTCAQLDLEPNTPIGLAYLIPYGSVCNFVVGYKGLLQLMYRSGIVASFNADVVYRQEVERGLFEYTSGVHPDIKHKILLGEDVRSGNPEDIVAAYAACTLKSGEAILRLVTRKDIDIARAKGGRNSPAWRDNYAAMAIKTAIRRLAAWMPTTKMADACAAEDAGFAAMEATVADAAAPADGSLTDAAALNAMIMETAASQPAAARPAEVRPTEPGIGYYPNTGEVVDEPDPAPAPAATPAEGPLAEPDYDPIFDGPRQPAQAAPAPLLKAKRGRPRKRPLMPASQPTAPEAATPDTEDVPPMQVYCMAEGRDVEQARCIGPECDHWHNCREAV